MLTGDNKTTGEAVARKLGIRKSKPIFAAGQEPYRQGTYGRGTDRRHGWRWGERCPGFGRSRCWRCHGNGDGSRHPECRDNLVKGDLAGIARAIVLSRATMRNIRQNLVFAFAYNVIGIPIAAGVLYPNFGLLLSPIIAALAMSLSSVSVIGKHYAYAR